MIIKRMESSYYCYFDGSCEPINPGGRMGYGFVVYYEGELVYKEGGTYRDMSIPESSTTNNLAEYGAFISLLRWLMHRGLQNAPIEVYGDSSMVINQMFYGWKIKNGAYKKLALEAREELKNFTDISGDWIPRESNEEADNLSKGDDHK